MDQFYNIVIPKKYSYGATMGPQVKTDRIVTNSGNDQRNAGWQDPLWTFNISYTTKRLEEVKDIEDLWLQLLGSSIGFLFDNLKDNNVSITEGKANSDGTLKGKPYFRLFKKYQYTTNYPAYNKRIYKLQENTVKVYNNGVLQTWSINLDTGVVTLPIKSAKEIQSIDKSNFGNVHCTAHGFVNDDLIYFSDVSGMVEVNNRVFKITKQDNDNFILGVNTTTYTTFNYVAGNVCAKKYIDGTENITWEGMFYFPVIFTEDKLITSYDSFNSLTVTCGLSEIRVDEINELELDY